MSKKRISNMFVYVFLSVVSFISVFPFYWMIVSATNRSVDITRGRLIPGMHLLENFNTLNAQTHFGQAFWNSLRISVTATLLTIIVSSMAGYGFEVYRSKRKEIVFGLLLGSMMIPSATMLVPVFLMLANITSIAPAFGLNTVPAIITPGIASVFLIFFFRQSTKMFAMEILEAARIDGLSELGMYFRIFVPIMRTTFAAAAIITFMGSWNSFLWPLIVVQTTDMQTLPLLISAVQDGHVIDFGLIMLTLVLSTIPIAVVFFVLQKHFVSGMMGMIK